MKPVLRTSHPAPRKRENTALSSVRSARDESTRSVPPDIFRWLLCLERKRSERSQRAFSLVLADLESLLGENAGDEILPKVETALIGCARETDIVGWYCEGRVFGLIFVEIGDVDRNATANLLLSNVRTALRSQLTQEQSALVRLSLHWFPEERTGQDGEQPPDPVLYPDLLADHKTKRLSNLVKRSTDIVGGIVGLILFSPLFLAIALLIKLTSEGPILFKQKRVGQFNKTFTMLKFRTMKIGNDPTIHKEFVKRLIDQASSAGDREERATYKITRDPRVTPLGRWLRKTSLDELPQFLNVLGGTMSLVGPRPPIPYELDSYRLWHRRRMFEAKPGITGLWQVSGRSRTTFDDMVRMDLRYARARSLWLDIKILLRTPRAVSSGQGAY